MAETLKSDHPDSTYAVFASLQMAKLAVERGDFAVAEAEFRWALEYADPSLEAPIRIRLARVLKADNRFELALEVLDKKIELFAYGPTWHEARGDILLMLKETDQARQAYQIAVNTSGELTAPSLIMKLEDITYAKVIPELTAETDEVSEPEEIEE
jgi:predicted negative regulator of RcsB-dependent stress response